MKRSIYIAVTASALLVGAISGCKKEDTVLTPVFSDGSQYQTTDGGKTWMKLAGTCYACQCVSSNGNIAGTCYYNGHEFSCQDWCNPGK